MDYIRLLVALLLPWLGGYIWLAALERRWNPERPNTLRQIGYGLFLGYAALQCLTLGASYLTGALGFWPILALVSVVTGCGAVLLRGSRPASVTSNSLTSTQFLPAGTARILYWVLLAWAALHLVLVAVEVLYRPVFPWDAWFNWTYRAKAWFYSGQIAPLDPPADWLKVGGVALYNVDGNDYPTFPPIIALWSAMALGYWSETLVNLPVLLCGIALVLALYGQCREVGMAPWLAALCGYMLLSTPLVGTHLSLAGQADIWMTGFTGLGFVALLHGLIRKNSSQIVLGLTMVAISIATKLEGRVWFLAFLATTALACRPRITFIAMAIVAIVILGGWLTGITYLEAPLIGGMGLTGGQLHIPLLGSYELRKFELWDDYWANFFEQGSWHLLWTLTLLSAAGLWLISDKHVRRALLAFYAITLLTQLFIFEGTESGRWAEDWTAINRLPLHFAPALVFSIGVLFSALMRTKRAAMARSTDLYTAALGLIITIAGTLIYLLIGFSDHQGDTHTFKASDMRIAVGSGRLTGHTGLIESFENDIAVLSSGQVHLSTQEVDVLQLDVQASGQAPVKFFWRTGNKPDDLHSTVINGEGPSRLVYLKDFSSWQGLVSELGVIFYTEDGEQASFRRLELTPDSWTMRFSKLLQDWSETSLWSLRSVNWISAGAMNSAVPLPLVMTTWVIVTLLASSIFVSLGRGYWSSVIMCAIAAWLILDIRWTINRLYQAEDTVTSYPLLSASSLDFGDDTITQGLVDAARHDMQKNGVRTIIMGEDDTLRFQILRAKYQALPASTYAHLGAADSLPANVADLVLVIRKRYRQPGQARLTPGELTVKIEGKFGSRVETLWDRPEGFLLSINSETPPNRAAIQPD